MKQTQLTESPHMEGRNSAAEDVGGGTNVDEVYEPAEDTHLLLRVALEEVGPDDRILEMGCGRGMISKRLAPLAQSVLATDVNPSAVRILRRAGIDAVQADLFCGLRSDFDLVLFNPPYLPTAEDEVLKGWLNFAFDGGETGRDTINRFLEMLKDHLDPERGRALLLISSLSGPYEVAEKAREEGLSVEVIAREKYFFEELFVLRLTLSSSDGPGVGLKGVTHIGARLRGPI
ncbi:MAG TPA: class I SAM-dependent methyltransferase [Methanothrix sp.]|nr:class I SAM-dependent methyltransferase [Methanothrix sp.]HPJ83133.1 class I SAM-dependent methyltransferase [Methanothrix sp.]HPR65734.1 class I SAM-dependent methyltransferase [Methanothrix sp.]